MLPAHEWTIKEKCGIRNYILDKYAESAHITRMTNTTITETGIRIELHTTPKSAKKSQIRWNQLGFKTRLYWLNENSEDTICGLEVVV